MNNHVNTRINTSTWTHD